MIRRRGLLALALAAPAVARAQSWTPQRPVRMIVPFAPAGILDQLARLLAEPMGQRLGQPIIVENRPGAGGNVGTALAARARGDAHVVLVGSTGPLAVSPISEPNLGYDPLTDLIPITLLNATPLVLVVRQSSEARDVPSLVAALKRDGREVLYPTPGVGSPQLLAQEAFRQAAGFPAAPVHYQGSAPAVLAVIAGEFPFTIENLVLVAPHVQAGMLRALGVTSLARAAMMPEVPTLAEQGFPGFSAGGWYGLLTPAGVPEEAIRAYHLAATAALAEPHVTRRISEMGGPPIGSSPLEFRAHIQSEMERWRGVMARAAAPATR
ncbi:tripartite tricarboxylate transporter substrate binding protein [Sediminicoccus sp. KRV36]|uniref:Bug family tripartite tricarboxylate transporter substrate binding protein n=1 Tax=Sediminicoccus sp. KRV36 TaxID=3133721 RepID=UPI00201014BB|nr:tripartite tricarboxylate transporter substrate binding protein [Sediminicoccus rosea]UPY34867.1 tripartite tricarboxylate transporter substrate binding protein [Sediminicoccus rosea]